jgi:hypothetical protein
MIWAPPLADFARLLSARTGLLSGKNKQMMSSSAGAQA